MRRCSVAAALPAAKATPQYDLVARELRMQEDQLYAMEDYLDQYQQLVCKYRSENAALRRQLAENGVDAGNDRAAARERTPRTPERPADRIDRERRDRTEQPPPDIESPEMPPLEDDDVQRRRLGTDPARTHGESTAAAGESHDGCRQSVDARRSHSNRCRSQRPSSSDVWLHGEVVANERRRAAAGRRSRAAR